MKPDHFWKQALIVFVCTVLGYALVFNWIESRRHKAGPWQVTFVATNGLPAIVINHPRRELAEVKIVFAGAALPPDATNLPRTVQFEHGRPAPFDLPFGRCVFLDTLFLPGTVTCEVFDHQIQLMPRALTIDGTERSWQSGVVLVLSNAPVERLRE